MELWHVALGDLRWIRPLPVAVIRFFSWLQRDQAPSSGTMGQATLSQ